MLCRSVHFVLLVPFQPSPMGVLTRLVHVVAQTRRESTYFDDEPEPAKAEDVPAAQQIAPVDPAQMQQLMQLQMQQQMMMMSQMQDPQQVRVVSRLNPLFPCTTV